MDFRLAADVLIRFAEDFKPGGDYATAQYSPLSQQGLNARPKLLGIQWDHNRIRIVDFGGTDRDLALLARYAVEPIWAGPSATA